MALRCVNEGTPQILRFAAGNAEGVNTGPYTVGVLYRRPFRPNFNTTVWASWTADNFMFRGQTIYVDDLWQTMLPNEVNANLPQDSVWRWLVVTRNVDGVVTQHWATYSQGAMTWNHEDNVSGTQPPRGAADTFTFGDPYGLPAAGSYAAFAAWETNLSNAQIEATFKASAKTIYDTSPSLFLLMPETKAANPIVDLMGGAGEISRTSGWSISADPVGFNFDHTGGTLATFNTMGDFIDGSPRTYNDGGPIQLGNLFVLNADTPLDVDDCYVVGGRVWTGVTNGADIVSTDVDIFLFDVPEGDHINPLAFPPVRTIRVPINRTGWTEGIFDTPWKVAGTRRPWMIAYQFVQNTSEYVANPDFRPDSGQWAEDATAKLYIAAASESSPTSSWYFGYFKFFDSLNNAGAPLTGYGVDTIMGIGFAPSGPSYFIWNGTAEIPATAKLWTGSTEVAITTEVAS